MTREGRLDEAFADLAQILVSNFDLAALLHRLADCCVTVCDAVGVGIVVADQGGVLRDVAYSGEDIRRLERFQLLADEGPCVECYRQSAVVQEPDLTVVPGRWPRFTPEARRLGIRSAFALPLRLRGQTVGALNIFRAEPGVAEPAMVRGVQALADLAVVGILQHGRGPELVSRQIKKALVDRSVIERAKGFLAEHGEISMDEAFRHLREHAGRSGHSLTDTAQSVIDRTLDADTVLAT